MAAMQLAGELIEVSDTSPQERGEMLALMDRYYTGVDPSTFAADLAEKQWIIRLVDRDHGTLRGFSTQMLLEITVAGQAVRALFSGDTIVDREFWHTNPLAQVWGRFALRLIDTLTDRPLYWFLITKGHRTYRFLPLFFHSYYPRFDQSTPDEVARTMHALARSKFPDSYDPARGVIAATPGACRLKERVADVTSERLCNPHVRYFVQRNPGHAAGEELCCLAPLSRENFTAAAWRVIGSPAVAGTLSR